MGRKSQKFGTMGYSNSKMSSPPRTSAYQKLHGYQLSPAQTAQKIIEPAAEYPHVTQPALSMLHSSSQQTSQEVASPRSNTLSKEEIASKQDVAVNRAPTLGPPTTPKPAPSPEKIPEILSQSKYPPGFETRSSKTPDALRDSEVIPMPSIERDEDWDNKSVEETITTDAAKRALSASERLKSHVDTCSTCSMSGKTHSSSGSEAISEELVAGYSDWEDSNNHFAGPEARDVKMSEASEDTIIETEKSVQVPNWFPKNIKKIYEVSHHGGALFFKELNEITRYRAALEIIRRRKWRKYIAAGHARFKLQQVLHKLRVRPLTKKFYTHRKKQYLFWKEKALQRWKRLEKIHRGILMLDELINTNFSMERLIYKKRLDQH